jgi:hypothetical protein
MDITVANYIQNVFLYSSPKVTPYVDEIIEIIGEDFDVTDQLPIRYSVFVRYWRQSGSVMEQCIS